MELKEISREEWRQHLVDMIRQYGLFEAVKQELDELVTICHPLGYLGFSEATERSENILGLIQSYLNMEKGALK